MQKLADQNHWESINEGQVLSAPAGNAVRAVSRLEKWWPSRAPLSRQMYSEYHFWRELLPRYIQPDPSKSVIEIGSAPGTHLIDFHHHFSYTPHGVEYTKAGVDVNRRNFELHGLDPQKVLHGDFFAADFHHQWDGAFDAVLSRGFVEHFDNVAAVVSLHVDLLKPGGFLILNIPNLQGIHHWMVKRHAPDLLPLHNLSIMNLPVFEKLFSDARIEALFCGYQGGLHLLMSDVRPGAVPPRLLKILRKSQFVLNLIQSVTGPFESRFTSPYLTFIGRRRD